MYDNIIFDLYGTLIDIHTDEEDIAVWKHMCEFYAEHGVKYNPAGLRSKYKRQVRRAEQANSRRYRYWMCSNSSRERKIRMQMTALNSR